MDVRNLLQRRKTLAEQVESLERVLRATAAEKERAEEHIKAIDDRLLQVRDGLCDGRSRSKPHSRRGKKMLCHAHDRQKHSVQSTPVCSFVDHHRSTPGGPDPSLIAGAFLSCGGGSVILEHLRTLWMSDSLMNLTPYPDDARVGCAIEQGRTLVSMGLCTPDAFAHVFGGCIDLSTKSVFELREMATQAHIPLSDRVDGTDMRRKKNKEQLRIACRALRALSIDNLKHWTAWKQRRLRNEVVRAHDLYEHLVSLETVPGGDPDVERRLNAAMKSMHRPMSDDIVHALEAGFLPEDHPARYRPSIMYQVIEQICRVNPNTRSMSASEFVWDRLMGWSANGVALWEAYQTDEAAELLLITRV